MRRALDDRAAPARVTSSIMDPGRSEVSGWRRYATGAFIVLWLGTQIVVPLVQKFELPTFRYRWARFSWAMFSRLGPRYEVTLFRTRGAGDAEPIPEIGRYVRGYRSPDPMPMMAAYWSEDEVHDRFSRLVTYLASEQRDGYTYVASIHWIRYQGPDVPSRVEFRAHATP
jgi:hypothetical protein